MWYLWDGWGYRIIKKKGIIMLGVENWKEVWYVGLNGIFLMFDVVLENRIYKGGEEGVNFKILMIL